MQAVTGKKHSTAYMTKESGVVAGFAPKEARSRSLSLGKPVLLRAARQELFSLFRPVAPARPSSGGRYGQTSLEEKDEREQRPAEGRGRQDVRLPGTGGSGGAQRAPAAPAAGTRRLLAAAQPAPAAPPSPRRWPFGPGRPEPGSGRRLVSVRGERGRAQDARRRRPAPLPARSQRPRRRSSSGSGRSGSRSRSRRCDSMSGAAAKQPPGAGTATDPAAAEKAAAGDSVPEPPPLLSVDVTGLVSQFARSFVLIFPVYVLGYLGLSFSWVLIALCGLFWIRRHRGGKTSRLGRALAFLEDEEEAVRLSVSSADLPAWVSERPTPLGRFRRSTRAPRAAQPPAGLGPVSSPGAAPPAWAERDSLQAGASEPAWRDRSAEEVAIPALLGCSSPAPFETRRERRCRS